MRRVYCDGCWHAGVKTDLTSMAGDESGRKYMTVSLTKAVRMDLCPSCLAVFERLKETLEKLEHQDMQSHAKKRQEIIEGFWREIRAKQETAGAAHERP